MLKKSILIVTLLMIVGGLLSVTFSPTAACPQPTPTPTPTPPPPANCSQGFWKNRGLKVYGLEDYTEAFAAVGYMYEYDDLKARGPGSEAIRDAVTAYLNQWFSDADQYCMD